MLIPCLHRLNLSLNAHSSPPLSPFERNCSSTPSESTVLSECNRSCPTPTMSIRAWPRVSHPNQVLLNATRRFPPTPCQFAHVPLLPCLPPLPCQFERNCSSTTSTVSSQARLLASHSHRVNSGATAHLPPRPCPFRPKCSSLAQTVSIRARTHLPPSLCPFEPGRSSSTSSPSARLPPQPFEPGCSSSTLTASLRA